MAEPNLQVILQQLQAEKGVDLATLLDAIRTAIDSAARKSINSAAEIAVDVDLASATPFRVFEIRSVVETVTDRSTEMSLSEAQRLNPEAQIGDRLKVPTEPKDFGRIAAQTAKQVIIQRMKDAERDMIYGEFKQREGELITGVVKRVSHGNIIVSIGRAEAIALLAAATQSIPTHEYTPAQVKQSVANYGASSKAQVQEMVRLQLGLKEAPQPDDAADALAVAICHLREIHLSELLARQGEKP